MFEGTSDETYEMSHKSQLDKKLLIGKVCNSLKLGFFPNNYIIKLWETIEIYL